MTDFSAVQREVFDKALVDIRPAQGLVPLLSAGGSFTGERADAHQVISFPVPAQPGDSYAPVPALNAPQNPGPGDPGKIQLQLTDARALHVLFTEIEWAAMEDGVVSDLKMEEMKRTIAKLSNEFIRDVIQSKYTGVAYSAGDATQKMFQPLAPGSVTPEGPEHNLNAYWDAAEILETTNVMATGKFAMLTGRTKTNILRLPIFQEAQKAGDNTARTTGQFGKIEDTNFFSTVFAPTHTAGTMTANVTVDVAPVIGQKTVSVTTDGTGTYTLVVGDLIKFSGTEAGRTYAVTAASTVGTGQVNQVINISPAIREEFSTGLPEVAIGATLSVIPDHQVELVASPDAWAVAMRSDFGPTQVQNPGTQAGTTIQDDVTGMVYNVRGIQEYRRWRWEISYLAGAILKDPRFAVRLLQQP